MTATLDAKIVLEKCWGAGTDPETITIGKFCRWCHWSKRRGHDPECPCTSLAAEIARREAAEDALREIAKGEGPFS